MTHRSSFDGYSDDEDSSDAAPEWRSPEASPPDLAARGRDLYPSIDDSFIGGVTEEERKIQAEDPFTQGVDDAMRAFSTYMDLVAKPKCASLRPEMGEDHTEYWKAVYDLCSPENVIRYMIKMVREVPGDIPWEGRGTVINHQYRMGICTALKVTDLSGLITGVSPANPDIEKAFADLTKSAREESRRPRWVRWLRKIFSSKISVRITSNPDLE